ncbi:MAG TPA: STAS domain-containing protein [Gemmataceae bacterium]|jgi:anti-anti-sigma factor|nr:STAS domain-containing protein [Gemmataceae bacterium]
MSPRTGPGLLEVEQVGEVTLVTITPHKILEEETTETISAQLFSLVKELGCRKMVLNFGKVERLTSVMLGKVVMLHRKAEAAGGRLTLCRIQPKVYEIFELLKLPRLLNIYDGEQQALQTY